MAEAAPRFRRRSGFEERQHVQRFLDAYAAPAPVFLLTLWGPLAVGEGRERAPAGLPW